MAYHALVPAAGSGSRMHALSGHAVPKQYLPLAGQPMIRHRPCLSERARRQGRPRHHRQRLPRPARLRLDGTGLPVPRPERGRDRPRTEPERAPGRLRLGHTVMHLKCEMTESNAQVVALINQYRHTWIQSTENIVALAVRVEALPKQTDIMLTTRLLCSLLVGIMVTFLGEFEETRDMNKVVSPAPFLTHILRLVQQSPILCD